MASVNLSLKELLLSRCNLDINKRVHDALVKWCISYEVRDNNPEAFNSPLIGIHPVHFLNKDVNALFDILGVDKDEFSKTIKQCKSVNQDFKVISDLYNLLTVWAAYCTLHSVKVSVPQQQQILMVLFKMMHYKFFTSVVNHRLKYGANLEVMQATIDQMSKKFDIIKPETNTWKLIIEARSKDIFDKQSIHYNSLFTFAPDQKVLYIITDAQTRIRTKLRLVINEYYDNLQKNNRIGTSTLIDTRGEEKTVKDLVATYDVMISNITNKSLNANEFVKHTLINMITKMVPNVRPDAMRTVLLGFSSMALVQYQKHKQNDMSKDGKIIIGYAAMIDAIIQKTYRACILSGTVDMKVRIAILNKAKDLYRSSRITDPGVLLVKESVANFVETLKVSERPATKASLKIAFILYIILLSFDYNN